VLAHWISRKWKEQPAHAHNRKGTVATLERRMGKAKRDSKTKSIEVQKRTIPFP